MVRSLVVGAIAGAVAGGAVLGAAALLRESPPPVPPPSPAGPAAADVDGLRAEVERLRREVSELKAAPPPPAVPAAAVPAPIAPAGGGNVADLLPPGTPPERVSEARIAAERIRAAALETARRAEATAAGQVKQDMERERLVLEDAARGGTMALLRGLQKGGAHLAELVADSSKFAGLFRRQVQGPSLSDANWRPREPFEDGTTVVLSEGAHDWDAAGYQHRPSFPKDVLLRGAGMDKTLLRINEIESRQEIHGLAFEDLTLDCSNHYFSDLRSDNPVTIRMARVRVVGFDMAAGGSVMLAANTAAFLAEECRFEAGYGRVGPGSGNLFRVRNGLLVRMDRCLVRGPFSSVYDAGGAATYRFEGCAFTECVPGQRSGFEKPPEGVAFVDCTFDYAASDDAARWDRTKPRSLSDFNPAWK